MEPELTRFPEGGRQRKAAYQENGEAALYMHYLEEGTLLSSDALGVTVVAEDYLKGVFDLAGELVRRAVIASIEGRYDEARAIHSFVGELYDAYALFEFRGAELRKGYDALRWHLKKLDETVLSIALNSKGR